MIEQLLKELSFSEKEVIIYLAIMQHGKITPHEIAKVTNINRSTVYSVAKELIKKGVISEDLASNNQYFMALPPDDLENIIVKKEQKLALEKNIVKNAITELQSFAKDTQYSVPKIRFIAEEGIENHLYKRCRLWDESAREHDNTLWGFQDPSFVQFYEKWLDWYWQSPESEDMFAKLITSEAEIERVMSEKKYKHRQVRFWKASKSFSATTWVVGSYIIMINTSKRPHSLVEIHDSVMAFNQRELFKGLWKQLKQ